MSLYLFYFLAFVSIFTALLVVFSRHPVHSVLYLILTFFAIAGQYVLMNAQFLFVVQLIVYSGAIMVLFLFVLMLLNLNKESEPQKSNLVRFLAIISGGSLFVTLLGSYKGFLQGASTQRVESGFGLVKELGKVLFTDFVVPFEISSILFLAAMVGAVLIGKRDLPIYEEVNSKKA